MVLAETDDSLLRGIINGIVSTRNGRVVEGDAEFEEYVNIIKQALEEIDEAKDKNSDRNSWAIPEKISDCYL